ncbi:phage terminase small subunit P27 family [Paenibacillus sp.]|uniref:phage terminase small subunit P27 family n=1 Tax=Paenibacillus sp. TaxID=58172 RepID=UPI002D3EB5AA|nr:phage terminase small subunit P27 family [Paenibacillus sp.]HZG83842.1 phage terminase small subunit P27 family [Paenibacillus sp.]
MAGRNKQPINLILLKGKSHLTKEQIEERTKTEVKAPADDVKPPKYLTKTLKKEFTEIASELQRIDLITNLDVDALARFLLAREQYVRVTKELRSIPPTITVEHPETGKKLKVANEQYGDMLLAQDKLFKQCRAAASDLGLTISSRCRLVVPKKPEEKNPTEEEQLFGDAL